MLHFIGLLEQTLHYSYNCLYAFPLSTDWQSHEGDWISYLKVTKDKRSLANILAVSVFTFKNTRFRTM